MSTVSVIIPARNAGLWLRETIDSVLQQTWKNLELLIVDDRSEDSTSEIVRSFTDARVRLLEGPGRGAAAARNIGLAEARGAWLMFLDADDLLSSEKIERQLHALQGRPSCIASCGWAHFVIRSDNLQLRPERCWRETMPLAWLQSSLSGGGMMQTACWMISRQIADRAGPWNEQLSLHDDGEYFTRVLLVSERNIFVDDCYVAYRRVPGSLSRRRSMAAVKSAFDVCQLRQDQLLNVDQSPQTLRAIAIQWLQYLYEFSASDSEYAAVAWTHIRQLQVSVPPVVGGRAFRCCQKLLGWQNAIRLRSLLRRQC